MSDQTPELPSGEEPPRPAMGFREKMSIPMRILGGVAIGIVTLVFVLQVVDAFRPEGKPLDTLSPDGEYASIIQTLVNPVFLIAGVVFVGVMGGILAICFKFRERDDHDEEDFVKQGEGNTTFEIAWTIAPALVLFVVGILTVVTIQKLEAQSPDALQVRVTGQQWWWGFTYDIDGDKAFTPPPETEAASTADVTTANELVIPTGRDIELKITSRDVIHSFWIPALNGKKDAVPGQDNNWKLQADKPGTYLGQCTEYCGLSHGNMRMVVRALDPKDFDAWVAGQRQKAPKLADDEGNPTAAALALTGQDGKPLGEKERNQAVAGYQVFNQLLCSSCHLVDGVNNAKVADPEKGARSQLVPGVAPDLTHLMSRGMFAGAIYNLHLPNPAGNDQPGGPPTCSVDEIAKCDPKDVNNPGNPANPVNRPTLEAWIRDPTKLKPMAPLPAENPYAHGKVRGMPNLNLTEEQIDQVLTYLETLR
jgi:cytochrome c oxidase subunit 2